ncbi:MAG: cytochrome b [Pseudomonadota bacterium]
MNRAAPATRYGVLAQGFHWLIAVLFVIVVSIAWYMGDLPLGPEKIKVYNLHKSFGVTILALALLRLAWRLTHRPPPLPPSMPDWEKKAAHGVHVLLYALLFLQPTLGIVQSWYAGFPISVFGLFVLPDPLASNEAMKDLLGNVHTFIGWTFVWLVVAHIAAALRHHFVLKDDILRRMLPGGSS